MNPVLYGVIAVAARKAISACPEKYPLNNSTTPSPAPLTIQTASARSPAPSALLRRKPKCRPTLPTSNRCVRLSSAEGGLFDSLELGIHLSHADEQTNEQDDGND